MSNQQLPVEKAQTRFNTQMKRLGFALAEDEPSVADVAKILHEASRYVEMVETAKNVERRSLLDEPQAQAEISYNHKSGVNRDAVALLRQRLESRLFELI